MVQETCLEDVRYGVELRPVVKVEDAGPKASHRFGHLRCRF